MAGSESATERCPAGHAIVTHAAASRSWSARIRKLHSPYCQWCREMTQEEIERDVKDSASDDNVLRMMREE